MTPKKLLQKLLRGYAGSKFLASEIYYDNDGYRTVIYDTENDVLHIAKLTKDIDKPLKMVANAFDDILFKGYGNSRYIAVRLRDPESPNLYVCSYMFCKKYMVEITRSGKLEEIADYDTKKASEEITVLLGDTDINDALADTVLEVRGQLIKMAGDKADEDFIHRNEVMRAALAQLRYLGDLFAVIQTKKMTPYIVKHRLIEIEPVAYTEDYSEIYVVPVGTYTLGEYTAVQVTYKDDKKEEITLRKASIHEVLKEIARRRI